jgi:phosphoglycolate phosphatase
MIDDFDVLQTSTPDLGKPDPEFLRQAAARVGMPLERVVMIGDSPLDVAMAKRAGSRSVAVLSGVGSTEQLKQEGPDHVLPGLWALASLPEPFLFCSDL